ncbi:MAG: DUF1659 domain-containing protein [Bacillus sp. (in: firmicutes)]
MANAVLISKQLRLSYQTGLDAEGFPVVKRKSFNNIDVAATSEQMLESAKAIAGLQDLPLLAVEQTDVQELED